MAFAWFTINTNQSEFMVARRYRVLRAKANKMVYNYLFPVPLRSLWFLIMIVALLHSSGLQPLLGLVEYVENWVESVFYFVILSRFISICLCTLTIWLAFVLCVRAWLHTILMYKGYLNDAPGKPSLLTNMYMIIIKGLWKCKPRFLTFQGLLPALPLPSVEHTVDKYLKSMKPLWTDAEYEEQLKQAEYFKKHVAPQLQRKLWLKWLTSPNYVSDWWKEYAYMKSQDSLLTTLCSGLDIIFVHRTRIQAARAATTSILCQMFLKDTALRQTMKPISLGGIPLCLQQYVDLVRTIRLPGVDGDKMEHLDPFAHHLVTYYRGVWYKLPMYHGKRMLRPAELEIGFQRIIDQAEHHTPTDAEAKVSALTCGKRPEWARARKEFFSSGVNKESLSTIENALECVFLDEEQLCYDKDDMSKFERWYRRMGTGDGYKLWCDRPNNNVIGSNGTFSSCGEHSVVDALIYCHIIEYIKYHESHTPLYMYTDDGHSRGDIEIEPMPERLHWDLNEQCASQISRSLSYATALSNDVDNASIVLTDYGKNFMKKMGVSPDAFIQMAIQLTYYKNQNQFGLTYESGMTRLFKNGRTDTIRSLSEESCRFVRAMLNAEETPTERLALLRAACSNHQVEVRKVMVGQGADRHLFAMYIVAKYLEVNSPFLTKALSEPWKLSTSQTPQHQQAEHMRMLNATPDLFWPAGAFLPPSGSDYGVCYTIGACGNMLSFHIAARKSDQHTDAQQFKSLLLDSLHEMRDLGSQSKS